MFNLCRHMMPSGLRCKSPALKGKWFCYFHAPLHTADTPKRRAKNSLRLPSLEDQQGIQIALMQILDGLASPSFADKRAGLYLYGLQIATQLAARASVPDPRDVVRSLADDAPEGEDLAPEAVQCDPGAECDSCATRDKCSRPDRPQSSFFSQALAWAAEPDWEDIEEEELENSASADSVLASES